MPSWCGQEQHYLYCTVYVVLLRYHADIYDAPSFSPSHCNSVNSKQQTCETHQTWICSWYFSLNIKHFLIS